MPAYVAMAHLQGAKPTRVSRAPLPAAAQMRAAPVEDLAQVEIEGIPLDDRLAERWTAIQHGWLESTFFLFDPDSWR